MPLRARVAAMVSAALLLGACSSGSDPLPPPRISSAVAERDIVKGEATLVSTVKVTFDREYKLAPGDLPFASNFELTIPLAEGGTRRVLVRTADAAAGSSRVVTLKVDALIPEDSVLKVRRSAFQAKATGTIDAKVESPLDKTMVLLASKALTSTSESLLADVETAVVTAADRDPAAMRKVLDSHLQQRQLDPQTVKDALELFDAIPESIVPSPKLRAALAALTGTFAEPAVSSLLTADNCTRRPANRIVFQEPPGDAKLLARVTYVGNGARIVSINPYAEGERIEHLMPILAHEAIHCDQQDSLIEEVAATAFDGFLYLELIASDESLVLARTRVARELNIDAIALINSGARVPESVGILPSVGVTSVLPGTNVAARSFAEFIVQAYDTVGQSSSPTEALAKTYATILAEVAGMPPGDAFDIRYLDELLSRAMNGRILLTAIVALGLAPED